MAWRDKSCLKDPELGRTKGIRDARSNPVTGEPEYKIQNVPKRDKKKNK